jgi:hypothetical protein
LIAKSIDFSSAFPVKLEPMNITSPFKARVIEAGTIEEDCSEIGIMCKQSVVKTRSFKLVEGMKISTTLKFQLTFLPILDEQCLKNDQT